MDSSNQITPEHVRWAYRLFLDREPENEEVLIRDVRDTAALRDAFMASAEYRSRTSAHMDPDKWVMAETAHGFRIWLSLHDRAIGWNVLHDCYEHVETAFVRSFLKPGDRVVDIGANIGYFSLLMASVVGPAGRVLAFEAMPKLRGWLAKSVDENRWADRIAVADCGLSDREGTMSLIYAISGNNSGGAYLSYSRTPPPGHSVEFVPVRLLDSIAELGSWRFIKMDVEGAELRVIRGATELLRRSKPTILCELHNSQLRRVSDVDATGFIAHMRAIGYKCRSLKGDKINAFDGVNPINVIFEAE